jgi:hypothetical protein
MISRHLIATALLVSVVASDAEAQGGITSIPMSNRYAFGGDLVMSNPRGEFRKNAGIGFGIDGHALLAADRWGVAGMRLDLGIINYGNDTHRYSCGSFCRYDATTSNNIINLQVGGQLVMPRKKFLPYVGASYGVLWFTTNTNIQTADGTTSPYRSTIQHDDATGSFVLSGGLYVPMSGALGGFTGIVGVRYFTGGEADYLAPSSLQCTSSGGCVLRDPYHSHTDFIVYHIGLSSSMGARR